MKVLFVHDHCLKKFKDDFFTTGGFSDDVTSRYTSVFEEMTLLCRATNVEKVTEGLVQIHNTNLKIVPIFKKKLLPKKDIIALIKKEVINNDRIIVRLPSILGIYAAKIAKKLNKPLCVEVVGSAFGSYWYKNLLGKIVAWPLEIINKKIIKKSGYVLYVSEHYLQKEYPTKGFGYGCSDVILPKRNTDVLKARIKKIELMDMSKKIICGTLGQIDYKYKGHKIVFKAIRDLKKANINIEYRLAGSGNQNYLRNLAKKYGIEANIIFYGQIKHDDIYNWIDGLDIYLQPSLTEGLPRSVIEATYRGCPAIVSNVGGMFELVDENMIFTKKNASQLVDIIKRLNRNELKNISIYNFNFSEKFELDNINAKRKEFYEKFKENKYEMVSK